MTNSESRPLCQKCNRNFAIFRRGKYGPACDSCKRSANALKSRRHKQSPWRAFKKDHCENTECTATIVHPSQLDVDHVDGNKQNNSPENLVTLCANCHRLKTYTNLEFLSLQHRGL